MPRKKPRYPIAWNTIAYQIRHHRADGQCECIGECGLHRTHPGPRRCSERDRMPAQYAKGTVRLTVAHLCACEPLCVDFLHLKALCNRCHLRVDLPLHQRHAAETRRLAKEALGQLSFLA